MIMADLEKKQKGKGKGKKRGGKHDKSKAFLRLLDYLFRRNGITEKGIQVQPDGFVNINDVLDVYPDYTEEDFYEVSSSGDSIIYRQCPQSGVSQIKALDTTQGAEGGEGEDYVARPQSSHKTGCDNANVEPERPGDKRISKFLSFLLRHGAEKEGFRLQSGGFLYLDEILNMPKAREWSVSDIQRIVANNDKKRFHLESHPDNGRLRIRANQGHSMQVEDLALQRITSADEFPVVVHGTYQRNWTTIKKQGLKRMNRTHIHFAPGEPGESGVISGMRGTCDILIYLHLPKALADGLEFYVSANNVILSPGDADGIIKPKYFASVFQRSPRMPLIYQTSN